MREPGTRYLVVVCSESGGGVRTYSTLYCKYDAFIPISQLFYSFRLVVLSRGAAHVPPLAPENYRTRPSKWTISGDFRLVSVAVHLRQRDLAATCGRADAQPPQFYGPTLTHEHVALVRSGVRAGEPGRVGG